MAAATLTACPGPQASAPTADTISTSFRGQDHGATLSGPAVAWVAKNAKDKATAGVTSLSKLTVADLPARWPAGLHLPGNCYVNPAALKAAKSGAPTLGLLIDKPGGDVDKFFEGEFGNLGLMTPASPAAMSTHEWTTHGTPNNTSFSALDATVVQAGDDAGWSYVTLKLTPK